MTPAASDPIRQKPVARAIRRYSTSLVILLLAGALIYFLSGNWSAWAGSGAEQTTDDAYLRADLTPLSTKVAGLVASVEVADYQTVKTGDLLVQLRDEDFQGHIDQAEALVLASERALLSNQRQRELQLIRIQQASAGINSTNAEIAAAEAGIAAAHSAMESARAGLAGAQADVQRTTLELSRQESLAALESTTRQKLEQVVAEQQRASAQLKSRESDIGAASALLTSRQADLERACAHLDSSLKEVEAQKRQLAVLSSQEEVLRADVNVKEAAVALARTNRDYTRIVAPEDGIVGERKVRVGQLVSPGTQILSLVQRNVWVQANYKENQLRYIREGDPAEVRVDAIPGLLLKGRVDRIAPASGSQFSLLPPGNATGNFTKVTQRVPVKIVLDADQDYADHLRPGLSVIATIRTNAGAAK